MELLNWNLGVILLECKQEREWCYFVRFTDRCGPAWWVLNYAEEAWPAMAMLNIWRPWIMVSQRDVFISHNEYIYSQVFLPIITLNVQLMKEFQLIFKVRSSINMMTNLYSTHFTVPHRHHPLLILLVLSFRVYNWNIDQMIWICVMRLCVKLCEVKWRRRDSEISVLFIIFLLNVIHLACAISQYLLTLNYILFLSLSYYP